jgi:hypothetical protein
MYLNTELVLALLVGVPGSAALVPALRKWQEQLVSEREGTTRAFAETGARLLSFAVLVLIFVASAALSAAGTYNPFIYFRF